MKTSAVLATLLLAPLFAPPARAQTAPDPNATEKLVLAFYYPWYGIPEGPGGAGRVVHWGRIDTDAHDISESTHYPLNGPYDSLDPQTVERHCRLARDAGLDGFIVSWWGHRSYEDRAMNLILENCAKFNLKATIYYEKTPEKSPETVTADIIALLGHYAANPAFLRHQTRPVIFVYSRALQELGLFGWNRVQQLLRDAHCDIRLIGDDLSLSAALVFDGIHTYNTAGHLQNLSLDRVEDFCRERFPAWVALARTNSVLSTLTLIPGYDDTKIRTPGLAVDRYGANSYRAQWQAAIDANPDWILITSFNEWHEGSEIEPSLEHGQRYIALTDFFARRFKRQPSLPAAAAQPAVPAAHRDRLRQRLARTPIAVLPDPDSAAFWFLASLDAPTRVFSWPEIAAGQLDPAQFPFLLYARGESYQPTHQSEDDVANAIVRYQRAGGALLVFPSAPFPFYTDPAGQHLGHAQRFGLNIHMGWESPDPDRTFTLHQPDHTLEHLPAAIPFPATGDRRWRPIADDGYYATYLPLLTCRDDAGQPAGDALAIATTADGRTVAYAWFALNRLAHAPQLLHDAFTAILDHRDRTVAGASLQNPNRSPSEGAVRVLAD